jgi:uncharacterized protein (DUF302 family)
MAYYINTTTHLDFDDTIALVKDTLGDEGFGVLSEIDVTAKIKEKLGVEYRNYRILGACNPAYAYEALQTEPYIGTMLPCNVVVQEWDDGRVDVAAIDPLASMQAVDNPELKRIAAEIKEKLAKVIDRLGADAAGH